MTRSFLVKVIGIAAFLVAQQMSGASLAQQPPGATTGAAPPAAPAQTAPSVATPAPSAQPPADAPAQPGAEAAKPAEDPSKASADASGAREVTLQPRPVLVYRGEAIWDEGYETLIKAFKALREEARRIGVTVVDKPISVFTETNDINFKYEAMVFIDKEAPAGAKYRAGMGTGLSPSGKAFVFKHVGAYDDIDSVYEAITAWLDEKNLTAKGAFLEEYMNEPQGSDDALLELQIYVFVE